MILVCNNSLIIRGKRTIMRKKGRNQYDEIIQACHCIIIVVCLKLKIGI